MARNRVDDCLLCGENPCKCNAEPRQTRAPKIPQRRDSHNTVPATPQPGTPRIPAPVREARPAGGSGVSDDDVPVRRRPTFPTRSAQLDTAVHSQEDIELRAAVTAVAEVFLLPVADLQAYRHLIDLPSWKVEAMIWRQEDATAGAHQS